ncbi:hypothetical protein [Ruminococcus flavefaciens]|uniref:hypothetical protein n=1 Tax=Ruminococcus flavefaciens TaxID=1265 RepID=UPI001566EE71|nr:hypothetical protein [Ruminococcus flavefaciens]
MQSRIIEAFNEVYGCNYKSFEEIKKEYPVTEILDVWLRYEGIVGYTRYIIDVLGECEVYIEE